MAKTTIADKAKRQPFDMLEEATAKDIIGHPRGSVEDAAGRDLLGEFGNEIEHPQKFVGRFIGGRK